MKNPNKASIFYVFKILEEYSDDNHYLTQQEIIDLIKEKYGVTYERKSIGRCLDALDEMDYDINKKPKSGYALLSRVFDNSEVKFLIDAVFSSKAISGSAAKKLSKEIYSTLSKYDKVTYDYLQKSDEITRTQSTDIFFNIEIIEEAIKKGKWIQFKYLHYDDKGKLTGRYNDYIYHVSPCYLVNNFGQYYLLGYKNRTNGGGVNVYRLDYISNISCMEDRVRLDPLTLPEFKDYSSIGAYLSDHIYLFGGPVVDAKLELANEQVIGYIKDWFGKAANVSREDGVLTATIRCNEKALFYWCM